MVIDCGISFPDEDMYGIDLVIPDIKYLLDNKDKVKGLFLTHGHEDHIGAIPYIHTPIGIVLHTGDFKIDYTPIDGRVMDLNRIAQLGQEGILLLMSDSTNVERSRHSLSEKIIGETLNRIISNAKGRYMKI